MTMWCGQLNCRSRPAMRYRNPPNRLPKAGSAHNGSPLANSERCAPNGFALTHPDQVANCKVEALVDYPGEVWDVGLSF